MSDHYVPAIAQKNLPFDRAKRELEAQAKRLGIHTIYKGVKHVNGKPTGEPAIVCVVGSKGAVSAQNTIPPYIEIDGVRIQTDVVVNEAPKIARLKLDYRQMRGQALSTHQQCHNCPVPGGVQIAPAGAGWVGTLSCALKLADYFGALTNAHVSGFDGKGKKCCQPSGRSDWIGVFSEVVGIRFDGQANYIDAAIMNTERTDGLFAPSTHTVVPNQLDLGAINPAWVKPAVGMAVQKSGRTTGVTKGKIVGIDATSNVGYDEGTGKFERQLVIEANAGQFSAGGDSGSLIMDMQNRPVGLLFAGGGGQTIANPIEFVLDWAKAKFFSV